jgi:cellulose synthase/poly-beta-1,6-N-acetylglucosamine synthase-like glycosyltransferase
MSLGWGVSLYLLATFVLSLDFLDLVLRAWFRRRHTRGAQGEASPTSVPLEVGRFTPYQMRLHLRPYALLVSVHNAEEELDDFLEAIAPYRDRLWVIDDASTDDTWFRLRQAGVQCIRGDPNRKKPGAIKELLAHLPPDVATVVVLDPDVRILDAAAGGIPDLERVVFEFQRSRRAAACPRIVVRPDGWLAQLQALEYCIGLGLGRKSLGDHCITSGVALYRRDALAGALEEHTLSVYAEDLKNALILLGRGESIYYDERLVIETAAKRTWRAWFSQRVGWHYGLLKVYRENFRDVRRSANGRPFFIYQYLVYMGGFTLLLHPFRLLSLGILTLSTANGLDLLLGLDWVPDAPVTEPAYFLFAYLNYTALTLAASSLATTRFREWRRLLPVTPLYFFYVLFLILPATLGYANWFSLRLMGRRLYRDHFQDEESQWLRTREGTRP